MTDTTDTSPILDGYVTNDGINVCVWCRYCARWHHHGHHDNGTPGCSFNGRPWQRCTCPIGTGDGHRVAHCSPRSGSRYWDTGYVVREVGHISDDELAAGQKQRHEEVQP